MNKSHQNKNEKIIEDWLAIQSFLHDNDFDVEDELTHSQDELKQFRREFY